MAAALELRAIGMSRGWIARELDVPQRTLGRWLDQGARRLEPPRPLPPEPYAYLLGLYLGDGHIVGRAHRLMLSCDAAYPGIIEAARTAMDEVNPGHAIGLTHDPVERCVRVVGYSRWWPVLFPQHGPGRKHARRIRLAEWQRAITSAHPRELLRGLIHSDGSRFVARQRVADRTYSYTRYAFCNRSCGILAIFCDHLELLGIRWSRPKPDYIAVDRRSEVAKLDEFVGPKR